MDPITGALVAALAAGVGSGVAEAGKKVIVDAYEALKAALLQKFGVNSDLSEAVEKLEKKHDSAARQGLVAEEIETVGAAKDDQLQQLAQDLIEALKTTSQGEQALVKYQVDVSGGQVGIIGDNAKVEGGIRFE